jgi:hypothetical protein
LAKGEIEDAKIKRFKGIIYNLSSRYNYNSNPNLIRGWDVGLYVDSQYILTITKIL